jgi:hypothetical protein
MQQAARAPSMTQHHRGMVGSTNVKLPVTMDAKFFLSEFVTLFPQHFAR